MQDKITIYADGAARGNPGPGGYGTIIIYGPHRKELSAGYRLTTNNRMELMAVIAGLEALKKTGCDVVIYTDSKYVADAVGKGWLFSWESKQFRKKKNSDLWIRFLKAFRQHNVDIVWMKGHNDNPENERCDRLAVEASMGPVLFDDPGYKPEDNDVLQF